MAKKSVKKEDSKKWFVLLIVVVLLSLVVNLLYLSVLYNLSEENNMGLGGSLATTTYSGWVATWGANKARALTEAREEAEKEYHEIIREVDKTWYDSQEKYQEGSSLVAEGRAENDKVKIEEGAKMMSEAMTLRKEWYDFATSDEGKVIRQNAYNEARSEYNRIMEEAQEEWSDENRDKAWEERNSQQDEEVTPPAEPEPAPDPFYTSESTSLYASTSTSSSSSSYYTS